MSKFVVIIFPDEKKAYEGLHAIKELHDEDSITLFSHAVIERDAYGRISRKERQSDHDAPYRRHPGIESRYPFFRNFGDEGGLAC